MKKMIGFLFVFCMVCALSAFAQGPGGQQDGAVQPWMKFEKQLGLQTTYSVDMEMQMMGMNMKSRTIRNGDKTRSEMVVPMMNIKMVALNIPGGSYSLFPDKKKYVINTDAEQAMAAAVAPTVEELGKEAYNGEDCIKRRVIMTQEGITSDMIMLFSPKNKNMPVKIAMNANVQGMPVQTVIFLKNYDFSKPDEGLFALPSDFVQAASMQEIMMESMPDMGAMMQQLQQMAPAE